MTSVPPSVAQALGVRVSSPFVTTLGLGIAATSYFLFGNLGSNYFGGPALITSPTVTAGRERKQRVETFAWFYEHAAPHMAGSAAFGALAYWLSAYNAPPANAFLGKPSLRSLLILAGGLSLFVIPWTVIMMRPINNQLINMRNADQKPSKPNIIERETTEAELVERLIQQWKKLHIVRIAVVGVSWLAGMSALTLAF